MSVPYVFSGDTGQIPLAQLDSNFAYLTGAVLTSIAALRLRLKSDNPNVLVSGYYVAGDGGGGPYYYDAADTSSSDNGGTTIVAADGGRWKLSQSCPVSTKQFGAKLNGAFDDTTMIQAALNCGALFVYHPPGTSIVSSYLLVPAGVCFYGSGAASVIKAANAIPAYVPWGTAHQGQAVLLNGSGASARGIYVNGNNFAAGGCATYNFDKNRIEDCLFTNCGSAQAVLQTSSTNTTVANNFVQYAAHGIEIWQVAKGSYTGNIVRVVDGGGIWTSDASDIAISGNTVSDCGDVGIDFEGGINCVASGNAIRACKNGELAYFQNGTGSGRVPLGIVFAGNSIVRQTTYLAGTSETPTATSGTYGGISVYSVNTGQKDVLIQGNNVYATGRYAFFTNDLGAVSCGVSVIGNDFSSDNGIFNIQRAYGIVVKGNQFHGIAGSENQQNQFKNCSAGVFDGNVFDYENTKTTNYALYYFTDAAIASGPVISNNVFKNCDIFAFKHDPTVSLVPAIIFGNNFSDSFVANGGIESSTAAYPAYRGQKINFKVSNGTNSVAINLTTLTSLKGNFPYATGDMVINDSGAQQNSYSMQYGNTLKSRDGSGGGTGNSSSATYYATFSGTTITLTGTTAALAGYLSMNMISSQ